MQLEVSADLVFALRMVAECAMTHADELEEEVDRRRERREALDGLAALRGWATAVADLSDVIIEERRPVPKIEK